MRRILQLDNIEFCILYHTRQRPGAGNNELRVAKQQRRIQRGRSDYSGLRYHSTGEGRQTIPTNTLMNWPRLLTENPGSPEAPGFGAGMEHSNSVHFRCSSRQSVLRYEPIQRKLGTVPMRCHLSAHFRAMVRSSFKTVPEVVDVA
jgi:hypothetical protein